MTQYQRTIITSATNKLLLALISFGIVFISISIFVLESNRYDALLAEFEARANTQVELRRKAILEEFGSYRKDVIFLALTPPIQGIIRAQHNGGLDPQENNFERTWRARLSTIFSGFLQANPQVIQARYIQLHDGGLEIVRVDRQADKIVVVTGEGLQQKGHRDYVINSQQVSKNEVYISDLTLNRENGVLSEPYTPTLRVITPIFDNNGNRFGLVVINIDANHLLNGINNAFDSDFETYLTNASGDFLLHPEPEMTFGFELGNPIRWDHQFDPITTNNSFSKISSRSTSNKTFYGLAQRLPLMNRDDGRFLTLVATISDGNIQSVIASSRSKLILYSTIIYLIIATIIFITFLGFQERLKANREHTKLAAIVDNSNDAIVSVELNGKVTSWNKAAELMFGYSGIEAIGKSIYDFLVPNEVKEEEKKLFSEIGEGKTIPPYNTLRMKKDGSTLDVSVTISPTVSANGEVTGVAKIIRDVSQQKMIEAEINSLNASLEQKILRRTDELNIAKVKAESANRAKSEFIANMSHEIRTPMNAIIGMLQLLQRTKQSAQQQDYSEKAESAANALLAIINDILDFSKVEAGKLNLDLHPFSLNKLMKDIGVIMANNLAGKNIELLFNFSKKLPDALIGDSTRIQQVLINLASNAIKFTPQGEIIISITPVKSDENTIDLNFSIKDSGIGISTEQQKKIFDGFSQAETSTSRHYGGTGLGLAISRRFVELMGGQLEIESEVGKGSTFSFTIGLEVEENEQSDEARTSNSKLEHLKVLLVDDNEFARQVIGNMLKDFGWQVSEISSAAEALKKIAEDQLINYFYDLVILDGQIYDANVLDAIRELKNIETSTKQTSIILTSAYQQDILNHQEIGALTDSILIKPITSSTLLDAVVDACFSSKSGESKIQNIEEIAVEKTLPLAGVKILLVEDNQNNQIIAKELLTGEGAQITIASGGHEALEILKNNAADFNIVLMDIQMPDIDGYQTTHEIIDTLGIKTLPIVAMTANVLPTDRAAALSAGMLDHIGKPFNLKKLVDVILKHARSFELTPLDIETKDNQADSELICLSDDDDEISEKVRPMKAKIKQSMVPQAALDFANRNHIDIESALLRLSGKVTLYQRLVVEFEESMLELLIAGKTHLVDKDFASAHRDYHSLKGNFATLGLQFLASKAEKLETQLKNDPANIDFSIAETLLSEFETLRPELATLVALLEPSSKESSNAKIQGDENQQTLVVEFEQLTQLLESQNLDATNLFERLRNNKIYASNFESQPLADAMDTLNFPAALLSCRDLLEELRRI